MRKAGILLFICSLLLCLGLRLYAALYTVPIKTWDDSIHRFLARNSTQQESLWEAVSGVFLPNKTTIIGRSIGYHSWMVLGRKTLPATISDDVAWQLTNVFLLTLTLGALFACWRLLGTDWFWTLLGLNLVFLAPIVFGINRWLMTEVHLMMALAFCFLALAMAAGQRFQRGPVANAGCDLRTGACVGVLLALASTMREYAIPLFAVFAVAALVLLFLRRRFLAVLAALVILSPYLWALTKTLPVLRKFALEKAGQQAYYNPFGKYVWHTSAHVFGAALTLCVLLSMVLLAIQVFRHWRAHRLVGKTLLGLWSHPLFLPVFILVAGLGIYIAGGLTLNTTARNAIPGFCCLCCAVIPLLSVLGNLLGRLQYVGALSSLLLAWGVMVFDLWIAFDGGRTYAHHPTNIEFYNHPLHLRLLQGPDDMHVVKP